MSYMLIDLNQVLISNLMQHLKHVAKSNELNEDLIRHMCINTIRANVRQFKSKYPNVVLCCDNRHYWRKDYFPFYKSQRKSDREASGYDWGMIFDTLNKIRDELKEFFPYKVIDVEGAEADDVIAVLTARMAPHGDVLILSSDKDFGQLQKYPNVTQYSPILKRFIKIDDPKSFIREHIIKGDRGDGIPNFLSADNVFAVGERQKVISSKKLTEWLKEDVEKFCTTDTMLRGYKRNQTLVDFDYIPSEVQERIVESFDGSKPATKQVMLNYFIEKGLKAMIESIGDF
jgi:5'-3' exonuclease, N-terminal resolvase-like domain/T4 RNase H, C terminal